jgi:hypothetical protein
MQLAIMKKLSLSNVAFGIGLTQFMFTFLLLGISWQSSGAVLIAAWPFVIVNTFYLIGGVIAKLKPLLTTVYWGLITLVGMALLGYATYDISTISDPISASWGLLVLFWISIYFAPALILLIWSMLNRKTTLKDSGGQA